MVQPNTVFCLGAMITGNQALFKKKKRVHTLKRVLTPVKSSP